MHILSTNQFTKKEIEKILSRASKMEKSFHNPKTAKLLSGKIIACIFFESSTRTRLSFETAALRLGAQVISAENALGNSSAFKGESIEDTARVLEGYADAIVMRHPIKNSVQSASRVIKIPIINAGDGSNQHPTQGLLDIYTIKKEHGRLDNLNIVFIGDILHSRTINSLIPLLLFYPNNTFHLISPKELKANDEQKKELKKRKIKFTEGNNLKKVLPMADIIYVIRVQKERFKNRADYEKVKDAFILKPKHLKLMKKEAIIMHALPRVNEIDVKIDKDQRAAYFRQAQNGLYLRMALLLHIFNL